MTRAGGRTTCKNREWRSTRRSGRLTAVLAVWIFVVRCGCGPGAGTQAARWRALRSESGNRARNSLLTAIASSDREENGRKPDLQV